MITLTNASLNDLDTIRSLAEKTWWPTYSSILEREQIDYMLSHLYSIDKLEEGMIQGERFVQLNDDSGIQGFISFSRWSEDPSLWKINKLYVLPENHGKGYGRMLISEICDRARAASVPAVVLNVNRQNPALHFYERLGFKRIREVDIPVGPYWMNDYILKLEL